MTRPKPPASTWSRLVALAKHLEYPKRGGVWKMLDAFADFAEDKRNEYLFKRR